jgi:hypothetical protein
MGVAKIYRSRIKKDSLLQVPSGERSFFLALAHLANEMNAIHKFLLWVSRTAVASQAKQQGRTTYEMLLLLLLAGKLKEGWELLSTGFFSGLSKTYEPKMRSEPKQALRHLKRYFGSRNDVDLIRNRFAFHYSPDEVDAILPEVDEQLDLYVERGGSANNLYYFAEALAGRALLKALDETDHLGAYKRLYTELPQLAAKLLLVADGLIDVFLQRHASGLWEGHAEEITLEELPGILCIQIPWFTDPSRAYDGSA